jgi:hypothetical protein
MVAGRRVDRLLDEVCWDRWLTGCVFALQVNDTWMIEGIR